MSKCLPRWRKREIKRGYYAVLDAIVSEKWKSRGYLLHLTLIRRLRRAHFKRKPKAIVLKGRTGEVTLRLDGRAP